MSKQPKNTQTSLADNDIQNDEQIQETRKKYRKISTMLIGIILVAATIFFYSYCFCPVLGHRWKDATCDSPQTCAICHETSGKALGHNWIPATYTSPKTCSVCGKTSGSALTKEETPASTTVPATEPTTTPTTAPTEAPEETTQPTSKHAYIEEKIRYANLVHIPDSFYDEPIAYTCISKEGVLMSGYGTTYEKVGGAVYGDTLYAYADMATPHGTWYFVENEKGVVGWAGFKMSKQQG